ncbi:ankyrin repeat protein-like [Hordeum vulgare]|nr:ankyrin repeat protein-like [Hordeum vulgare]
MARWMGSGGKGEAAVLAAVEDGKGDRALHLAAGTGWLEVCRYLVEDLHLYVNQLNFIGGVPFLLPFASIPSSANFYFAGVLAKSNKEIDQTDKSTKNIVFRDVLEG